MFWFLNLLCFDRFSSCRRCFPVTFAKFLVSPFLQKTSGWLILQLVELIKECVFYGKVHTKIYLATQYRLLPLTGPISEEEGGNLLLRKFRGNVNTSTIFCFMKGRGSETLKTAYGIEAPRFNMENSSL